MRPTAALTLGERRLGLGLSVALALLGLTMGAAARHGFLPIHGAMAMSLGLALVFVIGGALYDHPAPNPWLRRYYDAPTRFGIVTALIWAIIGMGVGVWVAALMCWPEATPPWGWASYGRLRVPARPASGLAQLGFAGLLFGILVLFWLRAADLLYALFFDLAPFPGPQEAFANLLTDPRGWALVLVGSAVGGHFAAFAFTVSLFSVPTLLSERRDASTAMGLSIAMTTHNRAPCLAWGAIVTAGMALSAATGPLAMVVVFPLLGHGTWHAYRAIARGGA